MSNLTIYVRPEDQPWFDKAKTISDQKLSQVIAKALREYFRILEDRAKQMDVVRLDLSEHGARKVQFAGRRIWPSDEKTMEKASDYLTEVSYRGEFIDFDVYVTRTGKILLYNNDQLSYKVLDGLDDFHKHSGVSPYHPVLEILAKELGEEVIEHLEI